MKHSPTKTKKENDNLLRQLLATTPRPTQHSKLLSFLSHSAWQGIGSIFGIMSFIATIILTIYIFELGKEQEIAHINYGFTNGGQGVIYDPPTTVEENEFMLNNTGPSTGNGVIIVFTASDLIKCESNGLTDISMIQPSKTSFSPGRCEFYYDYFYTDSFMYFQTQQIKSGHDGNNPLQIFISGANVKSTSTLFYGFNSLIELRDSYINSAR